jgi:hypothetical protein
MLKAGGTVLLNGVLVQDKAEIRGPTSVPGAPKYKPHRLTQPITLPGRGNPVRY